MQREGHNNNKLLFSSLIEFIGKCCEIGSTVYSSFQTTVESNNVIVIATLTDWLLKISAGFSTNDKQNQNQSYLVRVIFPALWPSYTRWLGIPIGSMRYLHPWRDWSK